MNMKELSLEELAEDFAQSLKEVYEKLIKAKDEAKSHPC